MFEEYFNEFKQITDGGVVFQGENVDILNQDKVQKSISNLVEIAALGKGIRKSLAQYVVRTVAQEMGIFPASINQLYLSRGKDLVPFTFTVPAMNLRVLAYDAARAVFRVARDMEASALIFEIARSEMNYTDQRPAEYSSSILGAAIAEGYQGPVFIQGDHFQVSSKKYEADPKKELDALKQLILEAIAAGFYNIDVDTSTLVDLNKSDLIEQQKLNIEISSLLTEFIRNHQPEGVDISIGGEIGEVGGHNSTIEELHAYLDGFKSNLMNLNPEMTGLSKISIQTGTSHGGVVLPDGTIASVNVDFETMLKLSRTARTEYGLGGAVQHGASTLPESAFSKFVEAEACEVHLATNFMNIFFDLIPEEFRQEIYMWLDKNHATERNPQMTKEQFYYKVRKNAVGPFKDRSWHLPLQEKIRIRDAWEDQFRKLFISLGLKGTKSYVQGFINPIKIPVKMSDYVTNIKDISDTSDLAD